MTAVQVGELAVVTGPLVFLGESSDHVDLVDGEAVKVLEAVDEDGDVYVFGYESHQHQYISITSLTPLGIFHADENVGWGDLLDPDYTLGVEDADAADLSFAESIHDYVFEGNE